MTTPTKTENQFFIKVTTDRELSRDLVKKLYTSIKSLLPTGLPSSIALEQPDNGIVPVRLIHTTTTSGSHTYEIPLTRHLTDGEFQNIETSLIVPDDFKVIKSAAPIKFRDYKPANRSQVKPEDYDIFCDTLAKRQHARWCEDRTAEGWRYGPTYSAVDRVSPLLRPWHDLPEQYRKVDKKLPLEMIDIIEQMGYLVIPKATLLDILTQ